MASACFLPVFSSLSTGGKAALRRFSSESGDPVFKGRMGRKQVHEAPPRKRIYNKHMSRRRVRVHGHFSRIRAQFFKGFGKTFRVARQSWRPLNPRDIPWISIWPSE